MQFHTDILRGVDIPAGKKLCELNKTFKKMSKRILFFYFFLFMSDTHHNINSSTQKYQSTQSSVVLTSYRQDSGSPPF